MGSDDRRVSWAELEAAAPDIAAAGQRLIHARELRPKTPLPG